MFGQDCTWFGAIIAKIMHNKPQTDGGGLAAWLFRTKELLAVQKACIKLRKDGNYY